MATMTAQHFDLIARTILLLNVPDDTKLLIARRFADELERTNVRFQRRRFIVAATNDPRHHGYEEAP